jgi:hypothetical protein
MGLQTVRSDVVAPWWLGGVRAGRLELAVHLVVGSDDAGVCGAVLLVLRPPRLGRQAMAPAPG